MEMRNIMPTLDPLNIFNTLKDTPNYKVLIYKDGEGLITLEKFIEYNE